LHRDITAFAMQFQAKTKANVASEHYWQTYLTELVVHYAEINLPALVESEEL
jgi:hypothetical protein